MWFAFPPGVERITVEQQEFIALGLDAAGRPCFSAPAHFAPRILAIAGFAQASEIVEGSELAVVPENEAAIVTLSRELQARNLELKGLREDYTAVTHQNAALVVERDGLVAQLAAAQERIVELEEAAEDAPTPKAAAKK